MAESKKTSPRKKSAPKSAPAPVAATPVAKPIAPVHNSAPVAKPAAPAAKSAPAPRTISAEERARMVQEAAYYRAEKRGFQGDPHEDWTAAEAEISAKLARENVRVV